MTLEGNNGEVFDEFRVYHYNFEGPYIDNLSWNVVCPADVDGSGVVDVDDLVRVILGWGGSDRSARGCASW